MARPVTRESLTPGRRGGLTHDTVHDLISDDHGALFAAALAASTASAGHGGISVSGGSTAQTGVNGTPAKMTGFTADMGSPLGTTPAFATDNITLDADGTYLLMACLTGTGDDTVVFTFDFRCTGDGTAVGGAQLLGSDALDQLSFLGLVVGASADDVIDIVISSDGTDDSFTLAKGSLVAVKVG